MTVENYIFEIEKKFFEATGICLYVAMELYIGHYPSEFAFFNYSDLVDLFEKSNTEQKQKILDIIDFIKDLVLQERRKHKDATIYKAFLSSYEKSLWKKRMSLTQSHREAETLYDEAMIKSNLVKHPRLALNPLCLANQNECGWCRIPFKPSKTFFTKYSFIEREYHIDNNGRKRYSTMYYKVNVNKLNKFLEKNSKIDLCENDIELIYFALYSPYLRGLIQNNRFNEFNFIGLIKGNEKKFGNS